MAIQSDRKDLRDLIMGDLTQFHIPIYQRTYTWESKNQVEQLLGDIIEFGEEYKDNTRTDYYVGNIIVKNQTRGFLTERVVIDGQQRITTTILILCAIRDVCLDKIKTDEAKQIAKNISNSLYSDDGNKIKLKLNNMEHQSSLTTILTGSIETITPQDKKTNYWKNYKYLYNKLKKMENEEFSSFTGLLERVKVVIIFLDDDQDENSVFESINSLGKPLSGSDLIKNFLFTFKNFECSHDEEKLLTDLYTKKFESLFSDEKVIEAELERFFREYIAIYTHSLVKNDPKAIYYAFKNLIGEINRFEKCKERIIDLAKWGLIYQTIRLGTINGINNNYLEYLRASFGTYANLLMDIIDKSSVIEDGTITVENPNRLNNALKQVVTYDACRFLGGYPAKEITRFIPSIPNKLKSESPDYYINYAKSFEDLVTNTSEGYRQPNLNILRRTILSLDLYNRKRKPLLRLLVLIENIGKNEILSFEHDLKGCQIEHIIPQTLNEKWSYVSNEAHEKYLHTLGNLSITFNNQNLSNKGFNDKKSILADKSRITLNQDLLEYDIFDINSIEDRAKKLLTRFVNEFGVDDSPQAEEVNRYGCDLFMSYKGIHARGILTENGLLVKEGSEAIINNLASLQDSLKVKKQELIEEGNLIRNNDALVFTEDTLFTSPSQAAAIIAGYSVNGKITWKTEDNRTLNDLGF